MGESCIDIDDAEKCGNSHRYSIMLHSTLTNCNE